MAHTVRRGRAGLLRGTALQATVALVFVSQAGAQPAPNARPTGGQVVAGTASIGQTAAATTISQASQRAAIDWRSFDVGSQHAVNFVQPNASAVTLNRVTGPDPSAIAGQINANGSVIITNPAGIVFHAGAQVNAASLVASTATVGNLQNFVAGGKVVFDTPGQPNASVTNAGTITVKETGLAALVAPRVVNSGTINARLGRVVLAGAEAHTIDLYGDGLVAIDVTKSVAVAPVGADGKKVTALVTNTGTVIADGGTVNITAAAADGIVQNLVNAGGRIQANSVPGRTGRIAIAGVGGSVQVTGRVAADGGPGQAGGQIAINASDTVTVASAARVTASGHAGGGTVALGTTIARAQAGRAAARSPDGTPPGTPAGTARRVIVEAGATVSASGRGTGSGGSVTALSTTQTRIEGRLAAHGGRSGGDGGVVETSSDGALEPIQLGDVSAPKGHGGTLYLDPFDLVIGTGSPTATFNPNSDPNTAAGDPPNTGTSFISPATLEQASQNGVGSLRLQASNDLIVQENINLAQGGGSMGGGTYGASLTLEANHDLVIAANITMGTARSDGPTPTLTLSAGHQLSVGPTNVIQPVTITAFGDITMQTLVAPGSDLLTSSISIRPQATVDTQGALFVHAAGRIDIGGNATLVAGPSPSASTGGPILELLAGRAITVSDAARLALRTVASSTSAQIRVAAGAEVNLFGANVTIDGGSGGTVAVAAGSTAPAFIQTAPAADPAGFVTVGTNGLVTGSAVKVNSGSAGNVLIAPGATVASQAGSLSVGSGSGGTAIQGTVNAGPSGTLVLNSTGAVTQTGTGAVIAGTLSGIAASYALTSANNQIRAIGSRFLGDTLLATSGDVRVTDSIGLVIGGNATVQGGGIAAASGGTVAVTADDVTIGTGSVSVGGGLVNATVLAQNGRIAFQPLTPGLPVELIGSGPKTPGRLSITQSEVGQMRAYTLQMGSATAGPLTVGAPGDTVDVTGQGGGNGFTVLDLRSAGTVGQASGSTLITQGLSATAGAVDLSNTGNQILFVQSATTSVGDFALAAAQPSLAVDGAITVPTGHTITLTAAGITGDGGTLVAPGGTIALIPYAFGTTIALEDFVPGTVGFTANRLQVGSEVTTGGITLSSAFTLAGIATLDLRASGRISEQAGGTLQVARLTGQAGSADLSGANQIATLGSFTTTNGLTVMDAGDMTVAGPLVDGNRIALGAGGTLTLDGDITAPRVDLDGPGGTTQVSGLLSASTPLRMNGTANFVQTGGAVVTQSITGITGTLDMPSAGNDVRDISDLNISGDLTLTTSGPLGWSQQVTAGGAVVLTTGGNLTANGYFAAGSPGATLNVGGVLSQGPNGDFHVPLLSGSAVAATLTNPSNGINALGQFTTTVGLLLSNAGPLTVIGPVQDGSAVTLEAAGTLTVAGNITAPTVSLSVVNGEGPTGSLQFVAGVITAAGQLTLASVSGITQSGGALAAARLTGQAGGAVALTQPGNAIVTLQSFSSDGGFSLRNGGNLFQTGTLADTTSVGLTVAGDLTLQGAVVAPTVDLRATGSMSQTGGHILATTLTGSGGTVALTAASNTVTNLGGFDASADFTLVDSVPVNVTGAVTVGAGATLSLVSDSIQLQGGGNLTAPGGVVSFAPLTPGTAFNLGSFVPSGSITADTLRIWSASTGDINITGTFNLTGINTLDLRSSGAVIEADGASLVVRELTGQARTAALGGPNQIGTLSRFTTTGGFTLVNTQSLSVAGPVVDATRIALNISGDLSLLGNVVAPAVDLVASGAISQSSAGAIMADTLTGSASSAILTSSGNAVTVLGPFTTTGNFALLNGGGLTVAGRLDAADVLLSATGGLVINEVINGNVVTLGPVGAVTEGSAGRVNAATLTGVAGSVVLDQANAIGALGTFTSGNGFTLNDAIPLNVTGAVTNSVRVALTAAGPISVGGGITAPDVSLVANRGGSALTVPGDIVLNDTVTAPGTLTLTAAGSITQPGGKLLVGTLTGASTGPTALQSPANAIGTLGAFSAGRDFALANAQDLFQAGALSAGGLIDLGVAGSLTLTGTLTAPKVALNATGAVTQPRSTITTVFLSGAAGSAALNQPNPVDQLGSFSADGDFSLASAKPLSVLGQVTVGTGHTLALTSDSIQIGSAGGLSAPQGTVALAPLTPGAAFALGSFVPTGSITATTLRVGSASTGDITVSGTFNLSGIDTLDLRSGGAVVESAGASLQVGRLTGAARTATLNGTNTIGELAGFTTQTGLSLSDGTGLQITGAVADGSAVTLSVGGDLGLAAAVTAPQVSLTATGPITQSSGALLTANVLTGRAASATFASASVGTLGPFTTTNAFSLHDGRSLAVAGAVSASNLSLDVAGDLTGTARLGAAGTASLVATGAISLSGGLGATLLTGSAANAAISGATLSTLGRFATQTGFALSGSGFTVTGPVTDGASILLSGAGDVTVNGNVTAPRVALAASLAPSLISAGRLVLAGGQIAASDTLSLAGYGIAQTGGAISAGTLTGTSLAPPMQGAPALPVTLTQAGNAVGTLGAFSSAGSFSLVSAGPLKVAGAVTSAASVSLGSGPLTLAGDISAPTVSLAANGTIVQTGGTLTAGTLTGTAVTRAEFGTSGTASVSTLGSMVLTGSTLTLIDSVPLTVVGPVVASNVNLSAPGTLTLAGGQITSSNAALAVTQGTSSAATLQQTGTTTIGTADGGTGALSLTLPSTGGTVTFNDLQAPAMNVTLNLGSGGTASGTINAGSLQVTGAGGSASLFGSVAGQTGFPAATISTIAPVANPAYQLNNCTISAVCGIVAPPVPTPTLPTVQNVATVQTVQTVPTEETVLLEPFVAPSTITPKSFLDTTLGSILKTNLFIADLITIGIVRDPADPDLLLPNISDQDY